MFRKLKLSFPLFVLAILISACHKDSNSTPPSENPNLQIYLIDCPIDADEINIEIEQVVISNGSEEISIAPELQGSFNLLAYQNGVNALLISENLDLEGITSISLVLDDDIEIVVAGVSYDVEMPEVFEDGMTLGTNVTIVDGQITELTIDFDACESIIRTPDGKYVMMPHLNLFDEDGDDIDDNDDDGEEEDADDDDEIDFDDLEDIVEDYLAATMDSTEFITDIKEVELCDEYVVYIISTINLNNEESTIIIDENSDTNVQFEVMEAVDLMEEIKDYMLTNYSNMTIDNAIVITTPTGEVFYNLEVEKINDEDEETELIFNSVGEWICTVED